MNHCWYTLLIRKQDEGKIACQVTSNVPFERGIDFYDMKVYASGEGGVYEQCTGAPGGVIHLDVYANGGEGFGFINADFKVTDQAVEVIKCTAIEASVSPAEE